MSLPACDVIVPTRALPHRAGLLQQAVRSILDQQGVAARALVVINGGAADPALRSELERTARCTITVLPKASLPAALLAGRRMVTAPWFSALDDDDILLPGALADRLALLSGHPECDVVVSNGFRREAGSEVLHVRDTDAVHRDPLRAMMRLNWLLPGSWLGRSATIGNELFEAMPAFRETTYLGIRFATAYRMCFLDRPTVVYRVGTPDSLSSSRAYLLGAPGAIRGLLALDVPADIRAWLRRCLAEAQHTAAELQARRGSLREAWGSHWRSLLGPGGWRYLPYTGRMLHAWWRAPAA